jgi:hypothetical protein
LARGEAHESVLSVRRFIQAVKALMPPIFSRAGNKHAVLRVYFPIGAEPARRTDMVHEEEKRIDRRHALEM